MPNSKSPILKRGQCWRKSVMWHMHGKWSNTVQHTQMKKHKIAVASKISSQKQKLVQTTIKDEHGHIAA